MLNKKNIASGLIALIIIVLMIYGLPTFFHENTSEVCVVDGQCQHEEQYKSLVDIIPLFLVGGFILGIVAFYFFYKGEEKTKKIDPKILLTLAEGEEQKILSKLIEKNGEVIQTELSRIDGLGKVKAHRIIKKLEKRGVVEVEAYGKTNLIKLKKEIKETFKP